MNEVGQEISSTFFKLTPAVTDGLSQQ
jgi:hypothetical protein